MTGGGGTEQAMEWLLAHADDPGINDPPAEGEGGTTASESLHLSDLFTVFSMKWVNGYGIYIYGQ